MNTQALTRQFAVIGAELIVTLPLPARRRRIVPVHLNTMENFALNIAQRKEREVFTLQATPDVLDRLDLLALDVQPRQRHLLLLARPLDGVGEKRKFLCGHDERH